MADTNLNRRRILAASVMALSVPVAAVPALAAVTAPANPDAALLALCARFRADWTAMNLLPEDTEDEAVDEAGDHLWDLEDEIAATPAATLAGIAAKASVIRAGYRGIMADVNEGILNSLLRDIAALGKEAAHV